tara:strand:- start:153 stop:887 length:735 start_codon:yes stop_codon:yes gene_type:complete
MKAPKNIPDNMLKLFTMDGEMTLEHQYIDQASDEVQEEIADKYNKEIFFEMVKKAEGKEVSYYYDTDKYLYAALDKYIEDEGIEIGGVRALIIGSVQPWYEAILYSYGVKDITITEYSPRPNFIKELNYLHPRDLKGKFDIIISISSHEHCGLGRYGDPLDPEGDIKALDELREFVSDRGRLFIAVPVGQDSLVWNAHRIYGRKRLPILFGNWTPSYSFGFDQRFLDVPRGTDGSYQPVFVLKK